MPSSLYIVRPTLGVGGADRVTLSLLRHLPRDLFSPSLVLMRNEGELLTEIPVDVPIHSLGARSLWTAWLPLMRLLKTDRPEILFSTSSGTNVVASLAHLLTGSTSRLVLSERGLLRTELSWKRKLLKWLKRVLYPRADRITAVSQGVKAELVTRLHLRPESISVVYNPIVDARLDSLAAEPVSHPWFGDQLEKGPPVILTAGRMVPEKDHATLLRAFAELRKTHEARLVILGNGPLQTELEDLADSLGITDTISFPGYDPNPFKYMSRCQMFVLSSRFEGLPGALIQAMACGTPVISTDCPSGPSEILEPPDSGALVPVGDTIRLAEEIKRLLDDPEARRKRGEAARLAAQRFSVDSTMNSYVESLL